MYRNKMATLSFLSVLSCLSLLCIAQAQDSGTQPRSHGLAKENPVALSPSAFEFFHPNSPLSTANIPCAASHCAPLSSFSSASTQVEATQVLHEVVKPGTPANRSGVGAGGVAGIVFGFVLIVLLAMGVYYAVTARRTNANRATAVQPDV